MGRLGFALVAGFAFLRAAAVVFLRAAAVVFFRAAAVVFFRAAAVVFFRAAAVVFLRAAAVVFFRAAAVVFLRAAAVALIIRFGGRGGFGRGVFAIVRLAIRANNMSQQLARRIGSYHPVERVRASSHEDVDGSNVRTPMVGPAGRPDIWPMASPGKTVSIPIRLTVPV
jgi:hypothetical protein